MNWFKRWTQRDPKIVTPLPFRDLRTQDQLDAELERKWRAGIAANEARREARKLRNQPLSGPFRLQAT